MVKRLAVLGSPIAHSLSPALHTAAYRVLELDWEYGLADVATGGLAAFLENLDDSWVGLSLTMPLKREVIALLDEASPLVEELGVANTLLLARDGAELRLAGFNTDVDGIVRAIEWRAGRAAGIAAHAAILGGGATASSALAAAVRLGATDIALYLRDPARASTQAELAARLGVPLEVRPLDELAESGPLGLVLSTLPGGVELPPVLPSGPDAILLDVAYDPWPSRLAEAWESAGGVAVSGLDMLLEQAVGQIRLFTGGAQDQPLADEAEVRAAMRAAVDLPA
jgi:shikimate dehydrogenase